MDAQEKFYRWMFVVYAIVACAIGYVALSVLMN
jgi:hypothetical protein